MRAKSLSYSAKRLIFILSFQRSMQIFALEYVIINLIYESKMFSSYVAYDFTFTTDVKGSIYNTIDFANNARNNILLM